MTERKPLVLLDNGKIGQLPDGDTIIGSSGGGPTVAELTAAIQEAENLQALPVRPTGLTTIRTFSGQVSELNEPPTVFTAIADAPDFCRQIQITGSGIDLTNAPSSAIFYIWRDPVGPDLPQLIGTATAGPRINGLADGFYTFGTVTLDVFGAAGDRYGVKVQLPSQVFAFTVDPVADKALINASGIDADTLLSLNTSGVLPLGLSGFLTAIATDTDVASISGATFLAGESIRVNLQTIAANVIPQLGLSYRFSANNVDLVNNTITFNAPNTTQALLQVGDTLRFRAAPGNTLPSIAGTAIAPGTTYTVLTATGPAGAQTITLTTDGVTQLDVTAIGLGDFLYAFRFPFIPLTMLAGGQLSFDGITAINFANDINAASVTVTAAGTPAVVTHTAHGYTAGTPIPFGGTAAPGLAQLGITYFVGANGITPNSYQVCLVPGGPAVAFSNAGTAVTVNGVAVTVAPGTPATFTRQAHFLAALQPLRFGGATLPGTLTTDPYYVIANGLAASTFQVSQLPASPPVALTTVGSGVTMTVLVSGVGSLPVERIRAHAVNPTQSGIQLAATAGGTPIDITTVGSGNHTLTPVNPPTIAAGTIQVRVVS